MVTSSKNKPGRVLLRRLGFGVGGVAVLWFAIEGGEYGTRDLWSQSGRKAKLDAQVEQLKNDVDSLQRELQSLRADDARLERVARENFGMVKGDKELLYRFGTAPLAPAESASKAPAKP